MSTPENKRMDSMNYQLKYFYLINADKIIDSILKDINGKTNNPHSFLETVFKYVFEGMNPYADFISLDSFHPFFNESPHNEQIRGLCQLIYLSLQNNCILNAFFQEIAIKSSKIEITAKNEPNIKRAIMDIINNGSCKANNKGEVNSQFFNRRKQIFYGSANIYTKDILMSINISDIPPSKMKPLTTLQYLSPAANFLFTEDACTKFARSLDGNKNVLNLYNRLWNQYTSQLKQYDQEIDKLIFESEINSIFGFSFFNSVLKYIEKIRKINLSKDKTLKDLEGQPFINIIQQAANLPLFFNKELLLRYACTAFLQSPQTDYSYFEQSAKYGTFQVDSSLSKALQVISCLELMRKFFQVLNYVTMPVMYSLWEVVMYGLQQRNSLEKDVIHYYKDYLSNNYILYNYDFNLISDDTIFKWGTPKFTTDTQLNNKNLLKYIKEYPVTYDITTNNQGGEICSIFPTEYSNYSRENILQLIKSYCTIDSLKDLRSPFFFLAGENLSCYSPLSKLIESSIYNNDDTEMPIGKNNFIIKHKYNLFDYLFTKE